MPSSSKEHKTLPRCTFQARLQQLSPLLGRRRHRSLSSPKTRKSVPHLPCHGHPGMRTQRIKRLAKVPLTSPSPTAISRCPCSRRQRRGPLIPAGTKFFRGWRGYGGGRGSFYQKTPLPPQLSQTPSSPPDTQPRSQWPGWTSRHVPSLSSSGQGRISLRCSNRGSGTGMAESRARV